MSKARDSRRGLFPGLAGLFVDKRRAPARRPPRRRLRLEPLETRTLLAVVTVGSPDDTAAEPGHDPGTFLIALADRDPSAFYYVEFMLDGSATNINDYVVDGADVIEFEGYWRADFLPFTGNTKEITITPINDARCEPLEDVVLTLTNISGGCGCGCGCPPENSIGTPNSATITIADDDDWVISASGGGAPVEAETNVGTYTITRAGGPDARYAITVDFAMSGVAQWNVDYVLKDPLGEELHPDGEGHFSIDIPADGMNVTVTLDPKPRNDSLVEDDEDACMTLTAANSAGLYDTIGGDAGCGCGGGGGCQIWGQGGPFTVDPANNSATVTIDDDDHWQVSVAAAPHPLSADGSADATERLTSVVQDPGWFKVSRHADTDTSYAITATVDVYGEADGFDDYLLAAYYPSSAETPQPSAIECVDLREEGGQTIYTYSITLPARPPGDPSWNATEVYVKVQPTFDWAWEGAPATPGKERLEMSIVDATWAGKPPSYDAVATDHAQLDIHDGARIYIRTDSNNDETIDANDNDPSVKNSPGHPGRVLLVNTDDDNENGTDDKWERPANFDTPCNPDAFSGSPPPASTVTVANEDDLAAVVLHVWVESLLPENPANPVEVDVYAVAPNDLVMWSQPTKGVRIHRGDDADEDGRIDVNTRLKTLTDGDTSFSFMMYVEANAEVVGTVDLYADPIGSPGPTGADHVKMTAVAQGEWMVIRNQASYALATSSAGDTIAGLADQIGLNAGEWVGWLRGERSRSTGHAGGHNDRTRGRFDAGLTLGNGTDASGSEHDPHGVVWRRGQLGQVVHGLV